ncbi:MAG: hypothetical protein HKN18_10605, partial [Silicimonas sp.]|nr:hypothetical protein [Silicimonas sp.]
LPAIGRLNAAYDTAGASNQLETFIDPKTGHGESAEMRVRVLDFLDRAPGLGPV